MASSASGASGGSGATRAGRRASAVSNRIVPSSLPSPPARPTTATPAPYAAFARVRPSSGAVAGGEELEGAAALLGRAEGGGHEVGGADAGEVVELGGDRVLVADDGHVGGAARALAVEHGPVRRQLPVDRVDARGALARLVGVGRDRDGKADDDARARSPG